VWGNLPLFQNYGICNEDIAVVVIFDGIDKLDSTLDSFFNDLDSRLDVPYN